MTHEIRIGDIVAVTARVTGLRGDGTYTIEPIGFDYDIEVEYGEDPLATIYTVDDPTFLRHAWIKGDEKFSGDGERYLYHENLGEGVHLLNRPDTKQHLTGAWVAMSTEQVAALRDEPPELSG